MMSDPALFRVVLLARTAVSAVPLREMENLRDVAASVPGVVASAFAFSEEGTPSLRTVLSEWAAADRTPIVIAPMVLPAEPSFGIWIKRTVARWQTEDARPWPEIRLAPFPGGQPLMRELLAGLVTSPEVRPLEAAKPAGADGSIVPAQKRRVLVCMGGPCLAAGAAVIWGHLRNEQKRRMLRTAGDGTMTAKTSCLGPCSLAPVVQVWPEGTTYGGVDETGIDSIIDSHLLKGEIVGPLAYDPSGSKQWLR